MINVVGAAMFPGAVHYLADSLSSAGLSILHISTFEYEVFLVQEQDIERACSVFRTADSPLKLASILQEAHRKRASSSSGSLPLFQPNSTSTSTSSSSSSPRSNTGSSEKQNLDPQSPSLSPSLSPR